MATIRQIVADMNGAHSGTVMLSTLRELAEKTTITRIYVDAGRFGMVPLDRKRALEIINKPFICAKAEIELVPLARDNFFELHVHKML